MSDLEAVTVGELLAVVEPAETGARLAGSSLLRKSIGGAEANVALTMARLGHQVGWVGAVGEDPFGREGIRTLRGAGVDVSRVVVDQTAPTGVYFKELLPLGGIDNHAYRTGSAASRLTYRDLDVDYVVSGRLLHLTGITALISESGHELITHLAQRAREADLHLSVDANVRRRLLRDRDAVDLLAPLVQGADTLFLSTAEAALLLGTDDPDQLQKELSSLAATAVVIHDWEGACAITAEDIVGMPARMVPLVDPTGAGDAFAAGYLSGWLDDVPMAERLRRGATCAAHAVASRGDNPIDVPRSIRDSATEDDVADGDSR
ncbi:MAG: sugar kinase [Actinomycetota bacterium]|nr:sugar kinase [Actinomycetota bacterium]